MKIKYEIEIDNSAIRANLKRLINQIFKLLPCREEGAEWEAPLNTIVEELAGMSRLIGDHEILFSLLCKLEGLFLLTEEKDFMMYRRTIFECLSLANKIGIELCQESTD